ncbi:MAG: guanylate kinase [Desulfovibrio sp.]|nr:guanylate kinase [Desulfovibrio sp.]
MPNPGIALVLSAPSGAGKSTLIALLRKDFPDFCYSVSCTTRPPRAQEIDGVDYHFIDRATFEQRKDAGYFAEWAQVHGNYYGTPIEPVRHALAEGHNLLFDIDVQGAKQLKQSLPEALFVFIVPPSIAELAKRLQGRGADSKETIAKRLANATQEISEATWYDALIVNDDLSKAYESLRCLVCAKALAPNRQTTLLQNLMQEGASWLN